MKSRRNYSHKTVKVLFALSGNQCAHPNCTNPLVEPATEESEVLVMGQICHIYAISADGPRGNPGLSESELNSPNNLLLLCPNHHALVDGQHETYHAEMLIGWKKNHESKMRERLSANLASVQPEILSHPYFPTALVDQQIEDEIDVLRKSRFFMEFDTVLSSLRLGEKIIEGELSAGTDAVRCRALAWCARVLSHTDELHKAEQFLTLAQGLGICPEIDIAKAFVLSQRGDKRAALETLAGLDTPASKAAALTIVGHHKGAGYALGWLEKTGISAADLDPDGRCVLAMRLLELEHWDNARDTLHNLSMNDAKEAPILHRIAAFTQLLTVVPVEFREVVHRQLPFELAEFPLSSDKASINARRAAQRHFADAAAAASELNLPSTATMYDAYALWLQLRDSDTSDEGRRRLKVKLRDAKSALGLVPLALQFGIDLDLVAVEQEIDKQITLNGKMSRDAALASLALAFTRKSPEDVANFVEQHYDSLTEYLDVKALRSLQIDMWARAGSSKKAMSCLELLRQDGISKAEEDRLREIISEAEGADLVNVRKEHYSRSKSLTDLMVLVTELETKHYWEDLCQYGAILFEKTHSVRDAERLVIALINTNRTERAVEFLQAHSNYLAQSNTLQMSYAQALYCEGALVESHHELTKLSQNTEIFFYRSLHVKLCIALGDWNSLSEFVAGEFEQRSERSAVDLMGTAHLAMQISSPHARELLFAAVEKGGDDARILANGYFLASSAGWENETQVVGWLSRANELSGDNGPIRRMSLKDILDQKPEWDNREAETWQLLSRAEIPLFLAAQNLRKSLIDLMLFPALANLAERDPRRRSIIPAYSGKRQPARLNPADMTACMDATALLTLSFLGLLDITIDAFKTIWVPHSTLAWLFDEKQKAAFHQPSRIKDSHRIEHLLATDALATFVPSTVPDSDLAAQVGDELALFIAEAEKVKDDDDTQRIVVRSFPVHRLSSLMEEEADLTDHAPVLSSCASVVDKLRQRGQITAEEKRRALSYLQLHENPWPNQPEIADGAVLYLDELAINYLLHLGILGKLKAAGLSPIVSLRKVSEASAFIAYESISDEVKEAIERIRSAVSSRIETGVIKVGRRPSATEADEQPKAEHPTHGVIALASDCDAVLADDRFLNQHAHVGDGSSQAPIFSTLDILDALVAVGAISIDDRSEHRTRLRRAGYVFVPVSDEEFARQLNASDVKNDQVVETAELKAIRESILQVRMSDWLRLPTEGLWLQMTLNALIRVLKSLWKDGVEVSVATARSNWIADQIDVRGWAHSFQPEKGDNMLGIGRVAHIRMLLTPPSHAAPEARDAYWHWAEERILAPLKEEFPDLYSQIVEGQKADIAEMAEMELTEREAT